MKRDRDGGQSSVEFALILPLVLMLVLVLAQVGLAVQAQISVTHTAREAARALAVDPAADAHAVAVASSRLSPGATTVDVVFSNASVAGRQIVEVIVTYQVPSVSPLIRGVVGDRSVEASAVMLVEAP